MDDAAILTRLPKETFLRRDVFGRTILHIAVLANDVNSFRKLLRSPDARHVLLATDYESGWNILHYIFHYKRLTCLNVLLEHLDLAPGVNCLAELLKRKDRCKLPPLALLQNDMKDMVWLPQYINEKNEYHLMRQFALDVLPRYIEHDWWIDTRGGLNVYVFGSNSNNNLGVGDSTDRAVPSRISLHEFQAVVDDLDLRGILEKPRFKQVRLSKYHSIVVTLDDRLFTCGMGSRGRLGHGNVTNTFRYKQVHFNTHVKVDKVAISNNHNVVLTTSNDVYAWGLNSYNQLGFTSSPQSFKSTSEVYENAPKQVNTGDLRRMTQSIKGVEVSKIHSVVYTKTLMFFWGLNIGQMGLTDQSKDNEHRVNGVIYRGSIVPQPKERQVLYEIKLVASCETCTCVVTTTNDMYIYYLGQSIKLPKILARAFSDAHFDCFKPSRLTSAPVIKKVVLKSHENIHVLLENGNVMAFSLSAEDPKSLRNVKYSYLWRAYDSDMRAVDIDNSYDGYVIVCTKNGSVFVSMSQASLQRRGSMNTLSMPTLSTKKKFTKVEHVNRVLRVSCDESFSSFAVIRDDIDMLSLKIQKNDFFPDLEYLSVLSEQDLYRKQDQLLDIDHDENSYITDFLFPSKPPSAENDSAIWIGRVTRDFSDLDIAASTPSRCKSDYFIKYYSKKFDYTNNTEPLASLMYQDANQGSLISNCLKSEADTLALLRYLDDSCKFFDGHIKFTGKPDIAIGFHTKLLEYRSSFCDQIMHPEYDGEYFIHKSIRGSYDTESKTLHFETEVEIRAILVLLHFMYTNNVLSFWEHYPSGLKCPDDIRRVKADFAKLMDLFRMDSLYGKRETFVNQLQQMADDKSDGDVLVTLKDGELLCRSSILVARSAFFETILSTRWETGESSVDASLDGTTMKYITLENVTLMQFQIILNHLHGCNDLHVFDAARCVVVDSLDSDDFVNFLLELIEVADELLIEQLKHLCELAISEFVSTENVLILLAHASWLGAHKLFMNCCWCIYNNLEVVIFDKNLRDLDDDLVLKLEKQICFLQNCKSLDFVIGEKGEVNCNLGKNVLELRDDAVAQFVFDTDGFNELYMSDRKGFLSFQPLRDVKVDTTSEENRRKLSSRKMSRKGSIDPLAEFRKLFTPQIVERKVSDSAVIDEEEFELVTNRKRNSKRTKSETADSSRVTRESSASPDQSNAAPGLDAVAMDKTTSHASSGSSSFAWVSRNSSTSSVSKAQPIVNLREEIPAKTKIKFAPSMKLSQKQRKKLAQEPREVEPKVAAPAKNPWKMVSQSGEGSSSNVADLPVLGSKKEPTPSLNTIMLQETFRVEEQKIQEGLLRTLQEIQQEQEFAKWWEEESKKVQMEMGKGTRYVNNHGKTRRGSRRKSTAQV